jgi:small subunit ribosomal protein S18
MARPRQRKRDAPERKPKKKISILDSEGITWVDYKDVALLRRFMSERAKIRARRVTGNDAQQQRAVARAIRVAREMALLPYSVRQVTHRSKGKRDRGPDGDRGDRGDRPPRREDIPPPPDGSASAEPTEAPDAVLAAAPEPTEAPAASEAPAAPEAEAEATS